MMCDGEVLVHGRRTCLANHRRRGSSPPLLVGLLLLVLAASHGTAGTPLTLTEARSILDRWKPEVYGAVAVKVGEIPYQASIRLYSPEANQHKCGGAIVSPWHILTAARCFPYSSSLAPESVFVVVGSVKRSSLNEGDVDTVVRKVTQISRHPDFSSRDQRHDLALLTLSMPLPMERKDRIGSIPLPIGGIRVDIGTTCVVSGWGNNTARTLVDSDALLSVEVPFIGRDLCAQMYEPTVLPWGVICTAHQKGGTGACAGDTGGPLVCNGFLAGIVSWGSGCGSSARPTVYTSVGDHVEWVRDVMSVPPNGDHARHRGANGGNGASTGTSATAVLVAVTAAMATLVIYSARSSV